MIEGTLFDFLSPGYYSIKPVYIDNELCDYVHWDGYEIEIKSHEGYQMRLDPPENPNNIVINQRM